MPHPERDNSINESILSRMRSEQDKDVDYHNLRERVRSGSLGDLDRDATWEALSDAAEGFDYDISEGYSAERGTQAQDEQDSARLSGLLGEFEKKFGQPDHWKWGPVGTDDYDYDEGISAGHDRPSGPNPIPSASASGLGRLGEPDKGMLWNQYSDLVVERQEATPERAEAIDRERSQIESLLKGDIEVELASKSSGGMDSIRSAVNDYQSGMDYGSPDVDMSRSMEYRGMSAPPAYGRRSGRGRMF